MNNAQGVSGRDRRQGGQQQAERGRDVHAPDAEHEIGERGALEELHDQEGGIALGSHVDDVHHVRVVDARGGLAFAQKAHLGLRYAGDRGPQRLDRETLLQAEVQRFVHHAHPAFAQDADDLVPAKGLPDLQSLLVAHVSLFGEFPAALPGLFERTASPFRASIAH